MKCSYIVFVVAALTTFAAGKGEDVLRFQVDSSDSVYKIDKTPWMRLTPRVKSFVFKNCGDPKTDLANVSSIVLGPDPVVFPGTFSISFHVDIKERLDGPLKGDVVLEKKTGSTWIKIPCIGIIGSCDYTDVCTLLQHAVCPPPFEDQKIPCKCPFTKGDFRLPTSKFQVNVPFFPTGDYHGVGNLYYQSKRVACVELFVTFG